MGNQTITSFLPNTNCTS